MRENDCEVDHRKNEPEDISKFVIGEESPSQSICNQQGQILVALVNLLESKTNAVDESLLKKLGHMASPLEGLQNIFVMKKDAALIDKIEGLNTKAQISDGSVESAILKEKSNASGAFNPLHKGSVDAFIADGGYELAVVGRVLPKVEETQASSDSIVGERTQSQMRGRFSSQENKEWRKKLAGTSTSVMSSKRNVDAQLCMCTQDHYNFKELSKKEESNPSDKVGIEPQVTSFVDATDYKAQLAKMKELATQCPRQIWDLGGWVDSYLIILG